MSAFTGLAASLRVLASAAQRATLYDVNTTVYAAQERAVERTLERIQIQAERLTAGQPKHRKAARTVRAAVERAERCARGVLRRSSVDDLVGRAEAVERAARDVAELTTELNGQAAQGVDEVIVGERPWTELSNVLDALGSGHASQPVQNQGVDQTAAIATLSAGDEHASGTHQ
jgi:hypothetical protein